MFSPNGTLANHNHKSYTLAPKVSTFSNCSTSKQTKLVSCCNVAKVADDHTLSSITTVVEINYVDILNKYLKIQR